MILEKARKLATDARLKAFHDVIYEIASQQELDSSYADVDDDSADEPLTQIYMCKNRSKCRFCEKIISSANILPEPSIVFGALRQVHRSMTLLLLML